MRRTSLTWMVKYKLSQVKVRLFKSYMLKFAKEYDMERLLPVLTEIQYFATLLYVEIIVLKGKLIRSFYLSFFKVGTHVRTNPCNKWRGQVPSCELAIFATKSSRFV